MFQNLILNQSTYFNRLCTCGISDSTAEVIDLLIVSLTTLLEGLNTYFVIWARRVKVINLIPNMSFVQESMTLGHSKNINHFMEFTSLKTFTIDINRELTLRNEPKYLKMSRATMAFGADLKAFRSFFIVV